jgi:NADH dehydrogenase
MPTENVLVLGGTGFIGRHIVARLAAAGHRVRVPTRRLARARPLTPLPTVEVIEYGGDTTPQIESWLTGTTAVINLVGILHSRPGEPWGPDFEQAHVALPRALIAACHARGLKRLLHMSALGVGGPRPLPSMYLRSKAEGERLVRDSGLNWTIFQPSVVFGADDRFLNLFARLQRFAPIVPLACAKARFQPIWVGDVAQAFVNALERPQTIGQCYALGGPEVLSLAQLVQRAGQLKGCRRPVIALPDWLGRLQARLFSILPGPPLISIDNIDSMSVDNVMHGPIAAELGIDPVGIAHGMQDVEGIRQARLDRGRARHATP